MTESPPCHELLAESLHGYRQGALELGSRVPPVTHASNLLQVAHGGYPQHLDCNLLVTIFALPHIRKSTAGMRDVRWAIVYFDLQ